jgi:hypothetical protein
VVKEEVSEKRAPINKASNIGRRKKKEPSNDGEFPDVLC